MLMLSLAVYNILYNTFLGQGSTDKTRSDYNLLLAILRSMGNFCVKSYALKPVFCCFFVVFFLLYVTFYDQKVITSLIHYYIYSNKMSEWLRGGIASHLKTQEGAVIPAQTEPPHVCLP